jgi:hypothetical protein
MMAKGMMKLNTEPTRAKAEGFTRFEILELVDISSFSSELKDHYRSHVLPMLKRLLPDGAAISFAFLSDPPTLEIRRMVG